MPRVAKPKAAPVLDYAPISELDALIAADEAQPDDGLPAKNESNDSRGTLSIPAAPVAPVVLVIPPAPAPYIPPCALDGAPMNSKIVVIREEKGKRPVFLTPAGELSIANDDVAWGLPVGAKIQKDADGRFVARQLDHDRGTEALICGTAREAIARFHQHFHG